MKNKKKARTISADFIKNKENIRTSDKDKRSQADEKNIQENSNVNCQLQMRSAKDRTNPFHNLKIDRFMEIYQHSKKDENGSVKFPGVGLENTQYFSSLMKEQKAQKVKQKKEKPNKNMVSTVGLNRGRSNIAKKFH